MFVCFRQTVKQMCILAGFWGKGLSSGFLGFGYGVCWQMFSC